MTDRSRTVEQQYEAHLELRDRHGLVPLGVEKSGNWLTDPRRLVFALSRYKFVSKMFSGKARVLEVGCGDGWPAPIVLQEVQSLHGIDIDPVFIEDAKSRAHPRWAFTCEVHDMLSGPVAGAPFDAAFSLDVLEHIPQQHEDAFLANTCASLAPDAELIIGMPSLQSQAYASPLSKAGHVNCKEGPQLRALMQRYFRHVFLFSMNDEVVHTGFHPMAQYLFAICAGMRTGSRPDRE
jgi:2-polyprenyl-3-methyl-5-hydroxy-6-metoxy-1,4-benzoquinol methylase